MKCQRLDGIPVLSVIELPASSTAGCDAPMCRAYAHWIVTLGKITGLFRFTLRLCALHLRATGVRPTEEDRG